MFKFAVKAPYEKAYWLRDRRLVPAPACLCAVRASQDLSWFEQKAVAVLLTLLHLGVKNIRCVLARRARLQGSGW